MSFNVHIPPWIGEEKDSVGGKRGRRDKGSGSGYGVRGGKKSRGGGGGSRGVPKKILIKWFRASILTWSDMIIDPHDISYF